MTSHDEKLRNAKLIELVREAIDGDAKLRDQFGIGEKFRFIRDKLSTLLQELEAQLEVEKVIEAQHEKVVGEDETLVYVYLFNSTGLNLRSWKSMLTPGVFYEHSVNRPIYTDKNQMEELLRSKTNKLQHAYLTMIVKKSAILKPASEAEAPKDVIGNPMTKVREGSLKIENVVLFVHNELEYYLTTDGELIKK